MRGCMPSRVCDSLWHLEHEQPAARRVLAAHRGRFLCCSQEQPRAASFVPPDGQFVALLLCSTCPRKRVVLLGDSTVEQTLYAIAHAIAGVHRSKLHKNLPRMPDRPDLQRQQPRRRQGHRDRVAPRGMPSRDAAALLPALPARGATLRSKARTRWHSSGRPWTRRCRRPTLPSRTWPIGQSAGRLPAWTPRRQARRIRGSATSTSRGCRAAFLLQTTPQHFASSDGSGDFFSRSSLHVWRVKKAPIVIHASPSAVVTLVGGTLPGGSRTGFLRLHVFPPPPDTGADVPNARPPRVHPLVLEQELWRPVVDEFARHLTRCPKSQPKGKAAIPADRRRGHSDSRKPLVSGRPKEQIRGVTRAAGSAALYRSLCNPADGLAKSHPVTQQRCAGSPLPTVGGALRGLIGNSVCPLTAL